MALEQARLRQRALEALKAGAAPRKVAEPAEAPGATASAAEDPPSVADRAPVGAYSMVKSVFGCITHIR